MNILDYVKKLGKVQVSKSRIMDMKKHYLGLRDSYLVNLYDKGYLKDPFILDKKEIFKTVVDLGINLINIAGIVEISEGRVLLEYRRVLSIYETTGKKDLEDALVFLELLWNYLRYENYCKDIDTLYNSITFKPNMDTKKININLVIGCKRLFHKCNFKVNSATLNCFLSEDSYIKVISYKDKLFNKALELLKIPKEDWEKDGLFIKGLKHECEVESCDFIFNGLTKSDGIYGNVLTNWFEKTKWSIDSVGRQALSQFGLYSTLLIDPDMINLREACFNEIKDKYDIFMIDIDCFYVKEKCTKKKIICSPLNMIYTEEGVVESSEFTCIDGVFGEIYSEDYLLKEGLDYSGAPISIVLNEEKEEILAYASYQLEGEELIGLLTYLNEDLLFKDEVDLENNYEKGSIEYYLLNCFRNLYMGVLMTEIPYFTKDEIDRAWLKVLKENVIE